MKKIADRIAMCDFAGGDVGNIWVDINGKQYHNIINLMETYYKNIKNRKFIVDYKKGEMFLDE